MKCKLSFLVLLCLVGFLTLSNAQKPNIWIQTDMTAGDGFSVSNGSSHAKTDQSSDPDDHVAMAMYLMQANKFNTVGIVMGVTNRNTKSNVLTFFNNTFRKAYAKDVECLNKEIGGYPSAESIKAYESSCTAGNGVIQFDNSPVNKYKNYSSLTYTVKLLVDELKSSNYSYANPLYVNVWGGMTEAAMAVKHLILNNETDALKRLFIVSHWTTSFSGQQNPNGCYSGNDAKKFGVANCNVDCDACKYVRDEARKSGAHFRWVDVGSVGQSGIVNGGNNYFNGLNGSVANQFRKSELGELFIKSKFAFGKPDGSDCGTFYTILGNYGVKLGDFNDNGILTSGEENAAMNAYKSRGADILDELLTISDIASSGNCGSNPPLTDGLAIPGKLEAEDYSSQSGIQTGNVNDVGGGKYVGWIGTGDWIEFDVKVASAGDYTVKFRVASASNNIKLDLKRGNSVLTSLSAPTSGNWQTWKTVTRKISLSAGNQTLRVLAKGGGWNINWIEFSAVTSSEPDPVSDYFFIDHKSSGYRLTVKGSSIATKAAGNTGDWVQWEIVPASGDWFYLVNKAERTKLNSIDGVAVNLVDDNTSGDRVQWRLVEAGDGWSRIENKFYQKWLHVKEDGESNFQLGSTGWLGDNTRWKLVGTSLKSGAVELMKNESDKVKVFPNPTYGILNVCISNVQAASFKLVDVTGVIVKQLELTQSKSQLDVSGLNPGVYVVVVENNGSLTRQQLVIK